MAPGKYTIEEKIFLVENFILTKNASEVCRRFHKEFGRKPPDSKTVSNLYNTFRETGSVADKPRSGRQVSVTDAAAQGALYDLVNERPNASIRRIAAETGIKSGSVRNILRKLDFRPYRPIEVQFLHDEDRDNRMEFCATWLTRLEENDRLNDLVLWSDESNFKLNGTINRHNCVYWSRTNPHEVMEREQFGAGVTVWAGMWSGGIIGPYFFEGTVTAESYQAMLNDFLFPAMERLPGATEVWFMQDGASPHYALTTRNTLDAHFENRWIGRRGPVEWPARSCDLTPLDFFLWGYLKNLVYSQTPRDLEELKVKIRRSIEQIPVEMVQNVIRSIPDRLRACYRDSGNQLV